MGGCRHLQFDQSSVIHPSQKQCMTQASLQVHQQYRHATSLPLPRKTTDITPTYNDVTGHQGCSSMKLSNLNSTMSRCNSSQQFTDQALPQVPLTKTICAKLAPPFTTSVNKKHGQATEYQFSWHQLKTCTAPGVALQLCLPV